MFDAGRSVAGARHVVAVLPSLAGGGAEQVVLKLMSTVIDDGMRATLVVLNDGGPLRSRIPKKLELLSLDKARMRDAIPALVSVLRSLAPDVVFSSLGYVNITLAALRWFYPGRLILREANMPTLSLPKGPWPRLTRLGYRLLYRRADAVLATSRRMYHELDALGVPPGRMHMLPNPVDVAALRRVAASARRPLRSGPHFVAAGRLVPQKGFDRLIPLLGGCPGAHLTILGEGPQANDLIALAKQHRVALELPGYVNDPPAWFASADALLLPSRWEGMSNVVLEALACGTPVIATPDAGGISEVQAQARTGAVVIADIGPDFRAAIEAVVPAVHAELRPSLLPQEYEIDMVAHVFVGVIRKLIRSI